MSNFSKYPSNVTLAIFVVGDERIVRRVSPVFSIMGKVNCMGGPKTGQYAKLGNQIVITSTMAGLVEGMVYVYKAALDVEKWTEAISNGAAGLRSLDLYGRRILKRDMLRGFCVKHFVKDLGICLKDVRGWIGIAGVALAQQLYLSLVATGEDVLGTQVLVVERLNTACLMKEKNVEKEEGKSD